MSELHEPVNSPQTSQLELNANAPGLLKTIKRNMSEQQQKIYIRKKLTLRNSYDMPMSSYF